MYKNEEEKLSDIVMGEAVMALLKEDAAISNSALVKQLQLMAANTTDASIQRACRHAISEVRNFEAANRASSTHEIRDRDNVSHLFTSKGPADGTKKH